LILALKTLQTVARIKERKASNGEAKTYTFHGHLQQTFNTM